MMSAIRSRRSPSKTPPSQSRETDRSPESGTDHFTPRSTTVTVTDFIQHGRPICGGGCFAFTSGKDGDGVTPPRTSEPPKEKSRNCRRNSESQRRRTSLAGECGQFIDRSAAANTWPAIRVNRTRRREKVWRSFQTDWSQLLVSLPGRHTTAGD